MTRKEINELTTVIRGLRLTGDITSIGATILAKQLGERISNFDPAAFERAVQPQLETK